MESVFYRFSDQKWLETKRLTQKDVALLVNRESKTIYLFEGELSTPRTQIEAKSSLGTVKNQFPTYKFRTITLNTEDPIYDIFRDALKDSQELQQLREHNQIQLEKSVLVLSFITLINMLISLVLVISHWENSATNILIDAREFTGMIQLWTLFGLITFSLLLILVVLTKYMQKPVRMTIFIILTFATISLIMIYWSGFVRNVFSVPLWYSPDNWDGDVVISGEIYFQFILISVVWIVGIMIGIGIAMGIQRVPLPKPKVTENIIPKPESEDKKTVEPQKDEKIEPSPSKAPTENVDKPEPQHKTAPIPTVKALPTTKPLPPGKSTAPAKVSAPSPSTAPSKKTNTSSSPEKK
jgi:hypothetical protein